MIVSFNGSAFDNHEITVDSFIKTLTALNRLTKRTVTCCYGKTSSSTLKIKGSPKEGSLTVDLIVDYAIKAGSIGAASLSVFTALDKLIELVKHLKGKKPQDISPNTDKDSKVTNIYGEQKVFNNCVIEVFKSSSTASQLDDLTKNLEHPGVEQISIKSENNKSDILKSDRKYFVKNPSEIVNESECDMIIVVVTPHLGGESKKWEFYDGEKTFFADIEDQDFLDNVVAGKYSFKNGSSIKATVRIIQTKITQKIKIERTILEVKEVLVSESEQ